MKSVKISLVCLCLLVFAGAISLQAQTNDAVGWLSLTVSKKVSKKLTGSIVLRSRFNENFTRYNYYMTALRFDYKLGAGFRLTGMYGFNPVKNNELLFSNHHKFYLSLSKKFEINKYLSFSDRFLLRLTASDHLFNKSAEAEYKFDVRNRFGVEYKIGAKRAFYLSDELWWRPEAGSFSFRRSRLRAGYSTDVLKNLDAELYFILQQTFERSALNSNFFIYGVNLTYTIK